MSIDPDAPEAVARPVPRPAPSPADGGAPTPAPAAPEPPPAVEAPPEETPPGDTGPPNAPASPSPARRRGRPRATEPAWTSALDDPAITPEGSGYRSFYVNDAVFARFRAAVYWTARRPDATDVPDNMSAGVAAYMDEVASDLERRYNDGAVFRPTPDQLRADRKRRAR